MELFQDIFMTLRKLHSEPVQVITVIVRAAFKFRNSFKFIRVGNNKWCIVCFFIRICLYHLFISQCYNNLHHLFLEPVGPELPPELLISSHLSGCPVPSGHVVIVLLSTQKRSYFRSIN